METKSNNNLYDIIDNYKNTHDNGKKSLYSAWYLRCSDMVEPFSDRIKELLNVARYAENSGIRISKIKRTYKFNKKPDGFFNMTDPIHLKFRGDDIVLQFGILEHDGISIDTPERISKFGKIPSPDKRKCMESAEIFISNFPEFESLFYEYIKGLDKENRENKIKDEFSIKADLEKKIQPSDVKLSSSNNYYFEGLHMSKKEFEKLSIKERKKWISEKCSSRPVGMSQNIYIKRILDSLI